MPTKVVFETAAFADAIKKADRIAPGRGEAFDKAAGIVLEVDPNHPADIPPVTVRATNLEIFSIEWIDALEIDGDKTAWRIPSKLFTQVVTSLPIGTGKTLTLEQTKNGLVTLSSGRTKARFNLISIDYYPSWSAFDPDELYKVNDVGGRINQVSWAADKSVEPICGIHLDGNHAIATDRYRLAVAPLEFGLNLDKQITVPANILGSLLKQTGEVMVGTTENQFLIMPDEFTQIRTVIYNAKYPTLTRIMNRDYPASVKAKRSELLEMMGRAANFSGSDRFPTLKLYIGKEEIAVMTVNEEVGLFGDVIEVPGQCVHNRVEMKFTPKNIMDAINYAPNESVELFYNPDKSDGIVYLDGGSGYECWVVPKKEITPSSTGA